MTKEKEFPKPIREVNLSGTDLRGAVINTSQLQGPIFVMLISPMVGFASHFEGADLRGANFTNAMMMQSRFTDAQIDGADFTNAVLDLPQQRALQPVEGPIRDQRGFDLQSPASAPPHEASPVTVITGFSGRQDHRACHLLTQGGQRLAVMVNEFGCGFDGT